MLQTGGCKHKPEADLLLLVETERVFVTRSLRLGVVFSLTSHSMEDLGFDLGEHRPPRRASVFVGQTAGCRTKTQLAPVRRRVQFRHPKRVSPLLKEHLRNKKSRADSSLQYYEDIQGLKSTIVGHARPPEDTGAGIRSLVVSCGGNSPSVRLFM